MSGFIKIQRDIFDSTAFKREPMSEREAFMWMIARAAWRETQHRVGSEMVTVGRGSFMATLREMQSAFMWRSDTKVRNFLSFLEGQGMIERNACGKSNAKKTRISICNYCEYQDAERTKNARKTHEKRSKEEVKEIKNSSSNEEHTQIAQQAFDLFSASAQRAEWPKPQKFSQARKRSILARLKECGGIDGWRVALGKAEASDFLGNSSWFGLDWMLKPQNFTKLMEGNYDNRTQAGNTAGSARRSGPHDNLVAGFAAFAHSESEPSGGSGECITTPEYPGDTSMDCGPGGNHSQPILHLVGSA